MRSARYVVQMLAVAAVLVSAAVVLNASVDPLNWLRASRFGLYFANDRAMKRHWIGAYPHDGILIGSSKVNWIDPRAVGRPRLFNASLNGASPEEMFEFLQEAVTSEKLVLLGLDLFMMNEKQEETENKAADAPVPRIRSRTFSEWYGYLFSLETAGLSLTAVAKAATGAPAHYAPSGNRVMPPGRTAAPPNPVMYADILKVLARQHYGDFRYSERRLGIIAAIKSWADAREIRLVVFLNPINVDEAALLTSLGADRHLARFRADMRTMFPGLVDFTNSYPQASNYFPGDPFHYLPAVGERLLEQVLIGLSSATDTIDPRAGRHHGGGSMLRDAGTR
jgi:hypothetical protein